DLPTALSTLSFTILAPSDEAMRGLPAETLAALRAPENRDALTSFLRRHLLVGRVFVDRKSTRLNSSHEWISYAVFCLKKKKLHRSIIGQVSHRFLCFVICYA